MSGKRTLLSAEEVSWKAKHLPHWKIVEQKKLARGFRFPDFQTCHQIDAHLARDGGLFGIATFS